jgi:hypothetical protein
MSSSSWDRDAYYVPSKVMQDACFVPNNISSPELAVWLYTNASFAYMTPAPTHFVVAYANNQNATMTPEYFMSIDLYYQPQIQGKIDPGSTTIFKLPYIYGYSTECHRNIRKHKFTSEQQSSPERSRGLRPIQFQLFLDKLSRR